MNKYIAANLAEGTAIKYQQDYNMYKQFCALMELPVDKENSICLFATHRAELECYQTIATRVAAIKHHLQMKYILMPTLSNVGSDEHLLQVKPAYPDYQLDQQNFAKSNQSSQVSLDTTKL